MTPLAAALAQLFVTPLELTDEARLLTYVPLALLLSVAYRATRVDNPDRLWVSAGWYALNMTAGMAAIGFAIWLLF